MEHYVLNQHLILSEKLNDCNQAFSQLENEFNNFDSNIKLQPHWQPDCELSKGEFYYLLARQYETKSQPEVSISLLYPLMLLFYLAIAASIFNFKLLPSLESWYADDSLPFFTELMFSGSNFPSGALVTFIYLLFGALFLARLYVNRNTKNNKPIATWLLGSLIFNHWIRQHNKRVKARILEHWIFVSAPLSKTDVLGLLNEQEWELAQKHDTLLETIKRANPAINPLKNAQINRKLNLVVTAVLSILIGCMVIAMYLPLFSMGNQI